MWGLTRYCRTSDAHDWDGWGRTLTEDVVFDAPIGKLTGRADVCKGAAEMHSVNKALQHVIANVDVQADGGDTAFGTAALIFYGIPDPQNPSQYTNMIGPYRFEFARTSDGWQIRSMILRGLVIQQPTSVPAG